MKLSNICCFLFLMLLAFHALADQKSVLNKAYKEGALAKVACRVVDEDLMPISNAMVYVSFRSTIRSIGDANFRLKTDCDGKFEAMHRTNWKVVCTVRKEKFYDSRFEVSFYDTERTGVADGEWVQDGLSRQIVLRRICAKEALSIFQESKRMGTWKIPVKNEWIGFDFELFDWTEPYGKGRHKDVLLRFSSEKIDHLRGKCQMDVCFTNNPYAGAYVGVGDHVSDLKVPHAADVSQTYVDRYSFMKNTLGFEREDNFPKRNEFFVFRTRTRMDDKGKLESACYGVISGVWVSGETVMRMEDAAFNTKENDVDIEDGYYLRRLLRQYDRNRKDSK